MILLRWLTSATVRHACEMRKHVRKLINEQRDLLAPSAIAEMEKSSAQLGGLVVNQAGKPELMAGMQELEKVVNERLKPYPRQGLRENIEVLLVAIAVAMGIRTFVLQPFKIPTGSMQPTLFGITEDNYRNNPAVVFPSGWRKTYESVFGGVSYNHIIAPEDGRITRIDSPIRLILFSLKQTFWFNNRPMTVWFPPEDLFQRAGLEAVNRFNPASHDIVDHEFKQGEDIMKIRVRSGDHLFVDRVTYNFRKPTRGEIIVFRTRGIEHRDMNQTQFYIKRLVGLGGEVIRIDDDRHVVIDNRKLDASTPHFESVYSFTGEPQISHYSGHLNGHFGLHLAPLFPNETTTVTVRPDHYMVMGDNTANSWDSRAWGDFPSGNVIGKASFIYWPILGGRFGFGYR